MGLFSKLFGGSEGEEPPSDGSTPDAGATKPDEATTLVGEAAPAPARSDADAPKPVSRPRAAAAAPASPPLPKKSPARQPTLAYDAAGAEAAAAKPAPRTAARDAKASPPRVPAVKPVVAQPAPRPVGKAPEPAPAPPKSNSVFGVAQESDADIERALTSEIDNRFQEVQRAPAPRAAPATAAERKAATAAADAAAVRATFLDVTGAHLRQLRDAMLEIRHGRATSAALGPAMAALRVVESSAQKLDDPELAGGLSELMNRLRGFEKASSDEERTGAREALAVAYAAVARLSPDALDLEGEHDRREPIIVRSLLLALPGVQKLTMEKLFAAGLGRLSALIRANAVEIEQTTGIEPPTACAIAERVELYASDGGGTTVALDAAKERERLRALLGELRREHELFEQASGRWSDADFEKKRRSRVARERVLRRIDLVLARMGVVDGVNALERMPVRRRIERLTALVAQASPGAPSAASVK